MVLGVGVGGHVAPLSHFPPYVTEAQETALQKDRSKAFVEAE